MEKVARKSAQYMKLILKMREKEISIEQVSKHLGCHRNSIYNKLRGKGNSDFTMGEALKIRDNFFPGENLETLFQKDAAL